MYTISSKGIVLIKNFEGLKLKPYRDAGGLWTIGYGHLIRPDENNLLDSRGITEDKAVELLRSDLSDAIQKVNNGIRVPISQQQVDALISLAFNIGQEEELGLLAAGAFESSLLLKMINSGASMNDIYKRWTEHYITTGGKINGGLIDRRAKEANLFTSVKSIPGLPDINLPGVLQNIVPIILVAIGTYILKEISRSRK